MRRSASFERIPELLRWGFARLYQASGGLYRGEIESWANGLGVSAGTATLLNCAYELSHLRWPKIFGCTAGVCCVEGVGLVHVRSLDWPLPTMGPATRLFRYRQGTREFVSVGVPGQVGVLSGMLPFGYSVTINWAPPAAFPSFDFGPTFLLRDVLETCDTYDEAVQRLTETRLSTSVFFTVCGIELGQACVIERTQRESRRVRPMLGSVLTQANHHDAARFATNNDELSEIEGSDEVFSLAGSTARQQLLASALSDGGAARSLDVAAKCLNIAPVLNDDTCQQMVFCPRTGEVKAWRVVDRAVSLRLATISIGSRWRLSLTDGQARRRDGRS